MAIELRECGNVVIDNGTARTKRVNHGNGIKTFAGNPMPSPEVVHSKIAAITPDFLRTERKQWRPEETLAAAHTFFDKGRLMIEGAPKNGKGTLLYGLSDICDYYNWGYTVIDGHFVESPADLVTETIREAEDRGYCVFYDSWDYLAAGKSSMRKISREAQRSRTAEINAALKSADTYVALTRHDENWRNLFLNPEIYTQMTEGNQFPTYVLPTKMQSRASIASLLENHDVDSEDAAFFATLDQNPYIHNAFAEITGDKQKAATALEATWNYPVDRKLVRFFNGDFRRALAASKAHDDKATSDLHQMIMEAEMERVFLARLRKSK